MYSTSHADALRNNRRRLPLRCPLYMVLLVAVGEVLEERVAKALAAGREGRQAPVLRVVGVARLDDILLIANLLLWEHRRPFSQLYGERGLFFVSEVFGPELDRRVLLLSTVRFINQI